MADPGAATLAGAIEYFVKTSNENSLSMPTGEKAFDKPLIGFSSGSDPLYDEFKNHIGDFYFTPKELFEKEFSVEVNSESLTVISWILPSTEKTRKEHAAQTTVPSERWARTRAMGENFNVVLREFVLLYLAQKGVRALSPLLSKYWSRFDEGTYAPCSNWSERHAAFTAGLGTFGLCDGLITKVGKAVRIGSVIAQAVFPPSPRPYGIDHHAYCLHFSHDTCRQCIPRCPVQALSEKGHDKNKCMKYTEHTMNTYIKKTYGIDTYACGLCQTGVACTYAIPSIDDI